MTNFKTKRYGKTTYQSDITLLCNAIQANDIHMTMKNIFVKNIVKVDEKHWLFTIRHDEKYIKEISKMITAEELKVIDFFERINLEQIAYELMKFIECSGRNWKARLKTEWENNTTTASLTILRNRFPFNSIDGIKSSDSEDKIFSKLANAYIEENT